MTAHKTHAQKRESILAAARTVAREGGLRAANVRAIASVAGTSPASVLYYFNTVDELVESAIAHVLDEFYFDRRDVIATLTNPVDKMLRMIELGVPDDVGDDMRLVYEVAANIPRFPQFAQSLREIHERQVELYVGVINEGAAAGLFSPNPDAQTIARNLVAIEDTYDFYPLVENNIDRESLRENLRSVARVSLAHPLR
jgi:AcrR family transcriptional regulator